MSDPDPTSYRQAYAELERISQQLNNGNTNLDDVLPLLEQAQNAYAVCQQRIEAVREVLAQRQALSDTAAVPAIAKAHDKPQDTTNT